jgi:tetratricopeptide (TPR) repeat protein
VPNRSVRTACRSIFPALLFAFLLGCGHSASNYLAKGNALFSRGKFAEASINYRKAIGKESANAEAYYRLALTELKLNKSAEAFQDLNQAVRLMPGHQGAKSELETLALTSYLGDPQRPKALYDTLVKLSDQWLKENPLSPEGLRIKGYLAMLDRRPEDAVKLFLEARQSNPKELKITLGLIDALVQSKRVAAAEKVGLDYLATEKDAADVYDALYRLYMTTHRTSDAEAILIRKTKDNPKTRSYVLQLAGHYARTGQAQEMARTMQAFLANPDGDPKIHLDAGDFYAAMGAWDKALDQYNAGAAGGSKDKLLYENRIARALLSQSKKKEGLEVLNTTLSQDPNDQEAQAMRAALLVGAGESSLTNEGVHEFDALIDKNPDDVFLKFLASKAKLESGDLTGARSQLMDIVHRRPHFLEAQVMLADISYRQGNMAQTVEHATAALEVNPNHLRAQMLRGSALLAQGSLDEAEAVLNRLERVAPQSVDVRLQLAQLALAQRKYGEAEASFEKMLAANPNEWRALGGLVDTDLAQNHSERAFARLEQALTRSRGAAIVRYMLASAALKTGKYDVAIENLRQLASQSSGSIEPHLRLADVYRLKGDAHDAVVTLQRAALLNPKDPRPATLLPFLLEKENRRQDAKAVAKFALARRPNDADVMNNLAFLLAETGDNLDQALKLAHRAVEAAPNNSAFADTLGYVYLKRGQNDDALEIFNRLAQQYPNDPTCAYHSGLAWYQKGDMVRAKAELTRALDRMPSNEIETDARDLLRRLE